MLKVLILLLGVGLATPALACSCISGDSYSDEKYLAEVFANADSIVHARVVSLVSSREAKIKILESFKGQPKALRALEGGGGSCGTEFLVGEEAIYISYRGKVSLCGRLHVRTDVLESFRAHKR